MLDNDQLLHLLNRHSSSGVSGAMLGEVLGVSRVTVQKRIQALVDNGLPIKAVPGVGYMLPEGVSILNEQDLRANLNVAQVSDISVLQNVGSTNSYLLGRAIHQSLGSLCVTESQAAGRGRRGNDWQSKPYRNVMMSLSWGFSRWPETITGLGLAVALVVCEHLREQFEVDVHIKWPNDLLVNDRKLAGVLIDVAGEASSACNVVIGLGLNVHQPDWSTDGAYEWQDLAGLGVQCDRNVLIAGLTDKLVSMLQDFERDGFSPLMRRWHALSTFSERRIKVIGGDGINEGVMAGVDSMGALLLRGDDEQIHRFTDSNVSVRLV
ncbi:biotin--[acetyl-CoA-carboxylase] ligase [Arenicella xantha]|uniref:Bifunctional ligase/repressor BirA n=1 Tax=Arenicella xantha TaxID=644221 RepID=A0A395JJ32_9GAMM|nr:biotin--[acetyl-CoA-carboxylase] ligase [Arenicella xantha]RBP49779.1 BirA family biotin operon repressor/biotin-[acetyl-CoA-carboxylase] ligase [Arenicella xantha]